MIRSLILAIIVLPGTGLVLIPSALLWLSHHTRYAAHLTEPNQFIFWRIMFFTGNAIYSPLVEEKGLEKRFGDAYIDYLRFTSRSSQSDR